MKWLLMGIVLIIIFALFRRMSRETTVAFWQARPDIPFDEFYLQYYGSSGLEREFVSNALKMVANATRVPSGRLRPEDRIDDLKPGAIHAAVAMLQKLDSAGLFEAAGIPHPKDWKVDTVDEVIRFLAPYYAQLKIKR